MGSVSFWFGLVGWHRQGEVEDPPSRGEALGGFISVEVSPFLYRPEFVRSRGIGRTCRRGGYLEGFVVWFPSQVFVRWWRSGLCPYRGEWFKRVVEVFRPCLRKTFHCSCSSRLFSRRVKCDDGSRGLFGLLEAGVVLVRLSRLVESVMTAV